MIGFLFTTLTFTSTLAANAPINAQCVFGQEAFLGFVGTVQLVIDVDNEVVSINGAVNNNAKGNWKAAQAHEVQIRELSDISNSCLNGGNVFVELGDFNTDANANLQFALANDDWSKGAKAGKAKQLVGRQLVINRNSSADILAAGGAVKNIAVACCVIKDVDNAADVTVYTAPATTAPATVAWPYNFPPDWSPPPGCAYLPPGYVEYAATKPTTTTTVATTTYYGWTAPPAPPPPTTTPAWDPYNPAPPPPPPPPPATQYYYYPTTTVAKPTTTNVQYCWTCPAPNAYGQWPPAGAYYYQPCPCVPSYYVKCPASTTVLAALAALVAFAALLF